MLGSDYKSNQLNSVLCLLHSMTAAPSLRANSMTKESRDQRSLDFCGDLRAELEILDGLVRVERKAPSGKCRAPVNGLTFEEFPCVSVRGCACPACGSRILGRQNQNVEDQSPPHPGAGICARGVVGFNTPSTRSK